MYRLYADSCAGKIDARCQPEFLTELLLCAPPCYAKRGDIQARIPGATCQRATFYLCATRMPFKPAFPIPDYAECDATTSRDA